MHEIAKQSQGHPLKICLLFSSVDQISWIGRLEGKKKYCVPKSTCTSTDKNAIANRAGPDENIN